MGKRDGKRVANVRVGKAEGQQTTASHTAGVKRGTAPRGFQKEEGIEDAPPGAKPDGARATGRRSTSINPKGHEPIDPRMPKLAPP
jgi:hypothetical protein